MDKFKIGVVFELEKEHSFRNAQRMRVDLRKKYDLTRAECTEIYRRIINYQIENFGAGLNSCHIIEGFVIKRDESFKRKFHRK